ncbi:methylated-DNA--[protein]-cysteine S-methyltransferase [Gemella haemolysans]|uniref:Methylated-DNA--protein-cysteine methyltransferase n=1 Tax=Gemella haemolysans ATCC 10379 TaxID=546270 RepID=C5NYM8_9BACL|nr:methylated-DNA--[protein]-cysteine S-methyltransferase [Gemella haemolysans]EER68134.1 6-O-methylguanine DNA methyltransferase, DNA binding domain protein [Gemella haemolysans ATCC 10379]KAA8709371.1 methylated-DNA--[protein]-cysteine S-methyltransferase [Gemella haemolysans]UBH83072.1 methylated-DNA--[protein]-cysteine S-methyltransferase [Gemella haemolysans]VEI38655.1 Methylated-DNA--protein-cysteine methyltransferase, constitutive [Gemella haemolysans]
MYYCTYKSKIGLLYLISDGESLIGCYLEGQKYFPNNIDNYYLNEELSILAKSKDWLEKYFNGENPSIDEIPLNYIGTEFRKKVWEVLKDISYGELVTYKHIAEKIAKAKGLETMSAQAVGGAVGHNPLLIFIPCHRVIGVDGSLTGYAAGLENKRFLLNLESDNNHY